MYQAITFTKILMQALYPQITQSINATMHYYLFSPGINEII